MAKKMKPFVGARVRIVNSTGGLGYVVTKVTPRTFWLEWHSDDTGAEGKAHEFSHSCFLDFDEELVVDVAACFKALKKCIDKENHL